MALRDTYFTPEEYFALEGASETKHEYLDGQIYSMAGTSPNHDRIARNIIALLHNQTRGGNCETFTDNTRIEVSAHAYFYPDASVVCGEARFINHRGLDMLQNPTAIFEILSPSTEKFDQGEKFRRYRGIESLREYVMIDQDEVVIERYTRQPDGGWLFTTTEGLDRQIVLASIGCTLALAEVYEKVRFSSADADAPGK